MHMAGYFDDLTKPVVERVAAAEPATGSGTRMILSTMPEVRDASLKVAKSAQRLLSIFTQDLEPQVYGEEPFLEAIKRLVLARSYAKVRVLLADPSRAMVDNNRFLALVFRLQADRWDGISDMNDPANARRYLNFFDAVWQTSMQESQMRQMLM